MLEIREVVDSIMKWSSEYLDLLQTTASLPQEFPKGYDCVENVVKLLAGLWIQTAVWF